MDLNQGKKSFYELKRTFDFFQFISDDEIIDENGNEWDPYQHPMMDQEHLAYEAYGVTIDTEGVARVERLDLQLTKF